MYEHQSVTTRRRRSQRRVRKRKYLSWLCNPEVLKAIIAVARLLYELLVLIFAKR
jgi:hypothetical protein